MNRRFADAFFYFALWNRRDAFHERARLEAETFDGLVVTTRWVLMEVADGLAESAWRAKVKPWLDRLEGDPKVQVIGFDETVYRRGLTLYHERHDKEWSLTDCISFAVMAAEGLTNALTGDRHFKQAGFVTLLR
jgi:predicted nucleic acid-binding protein